MQDNLTDLTFLVDRSGSMSTKKAQIESVLNDIIGEQKNGVGDVNVSVIEFDANDKLELNTIVDVKSIQEVEKIVINPRGWTPLYDALGTVIDRTGQRLAKLPEEQRPGKVVFFIVTDGGENSSKEFNGLAVKQKIQHQEEKYNWLFMYVGCDQDAVKESEGFGLSAGKSLTFSNSQAGYESLVFTANNKMHTVRGMSNKDYSDYVKGDVFNDEDREAQNVK